LTRSASQIIARAKAPEEASIGAYLLSRLGPRPTFEYSLKKSILPRRF